VIHQHRNVSTRSATQRGFTLVEMLVVLTIIGILIGLSCGLWNYVVKKRRILQAQEDMAQLTQALDGYFAVYGAHYPPVNHSTVPDTDQGPLTMLWLYPASPPPGPIVPADSHYQEGLARYLCGVPGSNEWIRYLDGFHVAIETQCTENIRPYGRMSLPSRGITFKNDPWGHTYHYDSFGPYRTYRLWCAGPDGVTGTVDDIESIYR
jgi:prepilin-type N-terminal cleavage/methylation domain-containing protein